MLRNIILTISAIAICNIAIAGTVSVTKQTHSVEGLAGVTVNQSSNAISYTVAAEYLVGDKITFTFPAGAIVSSAFPSILSSGSSSFSMGLLSSDSSSATYRITSVTSSTIGDAITLGSIGYKASAVLAGAITVTVSSQTVSGDSMDTAGTRTATVADAKSQFGQVSVTSLFDNIIQNDAENEGTSFTTDSADTITWRTIYPVTTGWLNLATVSTTAVTIHGEAGKMVGFRNTNFSAGGTRTFDESAASMAISYSGQIPAGGDTETLTFTAPGIVPLAAQSFKMTFAHNYTSAAAVSGSKTIANEINAGVWKSVFKAPGSPALLTTGVEFNHQINTPNGAFCDLDNVLDAGETSMMTVTLTNAGTELISGIKAQVSTSNASTDITFANQGMLVFADVPASGDSNGTTSASLEMTLNSANENEQLDLIISFTSEDSNALLPNDIATTMKVNLDYAQDRAIENFETPDTVWLDWQRSQKTRTEEDPEHLLSQWETHNDNDFGLVVFGPNLSQQNDISFMSKTVTVSDTGALLMSFDHYFSFETGSEPTSWDGGVIEIRVDGGTWTDVVTAGGSFTVGYNGTISQTNSALGGRAGFVGESSGTLVTTAESLSFAEGLLNGKTVQFRFRIGSDDAISGLGWKIDNISFTNITNTTPFSSVVAYSSVCVNRSPFVLDVTGPASALETTPVILTATGFDHDADVLSYTWTQTAGSSALNVSSTSAELMFDAPAVTTDEIYTFSVIAADGNSSSQAKEISVNITAMANAAPILVSDQSVTVRENETITLSVSGSDPEDDSLTYQWTMDGTVLSVTGASHQFTGPSVSQDTNVIFSITATDGQKTSSAARINVTVENDSSDGGAANAAPILASDQSVTVRENETITLSVSGSDPEDDSLTYQWTMDGTVLSVTGASHQFTGPSVSQDTNMFFSITASDGQKTSAATRINVTVENDSSDGGGSMGLLSLLLTTFLFIRRKKQA